MAKDTSGKCKYKVKNYQESDITEDKHKSKSNKQDNKEHSTMLRDMIHIKTLIVINIYGENNT